MSLFMLNLAETALELISHCLSLGRHLKIQQLSKIQPKNANLGEGGGSSFSIISAQVGWQQCILLAPTLNKHSGGTFL